MHHARSKRRTFLYDDKLGGELEKEDGNETWDEDAQIQEIHARYLAGSLEEASGDPGRNTVGVVCSQEGLGGDGRPDRGATVSGGLPTIQQERIR